MADEKIRIQQMNPRTRKTLLRTFFAVVFCAVLLWVMHTFQPITTVLLVSLLIAYILDPLVTSLESFHIRRSISSLAIILGVLVFFSLLLLGLLPVVVRELSDFGQQAPRYIRDLTQFLLAVSERLDLQVPQDWDEMSQLLVEKARALLPNMAAPLKDLLSSLFKSVFSVIGTLFHAALVPIIAYYLLVEFQDIRSGVSNLVPPYVREPVMSNLQEIDRVLSAFVRGQLTIALILAVLYSAGFLVIGIDLALVLGILSGLLWIIPYLGTLFALVAGSVMAIAKYGDLLHVLYVVGWVCIVQLTESYLLTPKIVGKAVGLHPVVYILALIVGASLFGFVGLLIAIPLTAIGKVFIGSLVKMYKSSYLFTDSPQRGNETKSDRP